MKHTIQLNNTPISFTSDDGSSILLSAITQGFNLPHSCQSGVCGQCKAKVLSGEVLQTSAAQQTLSEQERADGNVLLCCSYAQSPVLLDMPNAQLHLPPVRTLPARIDSIRFIHDVAVLKLTLPKAPPFEFLAGQYIEILLSNGQSRCYSIANSVQQKGELELHIRYRQGGLLSELLFGEQAKIQEKSVIKIKGPLGTFGLKEHNEHPLILLATGTGFAPIQSILHALIAQNSQRKIHLYWGGARCEDLYYLNEAQALCQQLAHAVCTPVYSQERQQQEQQQYVQDFALRDFPDMSQCEVYACGSPQMIQSAQTLLCTQGKLPKQAFFADAFTPN